MSDVIDFEKRRAQITSLREGLPDELRNARVFRRKTTEFELCLHPEVLYCLHRRTVECARCEATLDPIKALADIASDWEDYQKLAELRDRLLSEIAELDRERDRARARTSRAHRKFEGTAPEYPGELQKLRRLERYIRGFPFHQSRQSEVLLRELDKIRGEETKKANE